jgi:hypothetical protein
MHNSIFLSKKVSDLDGGCFQRTTTGFGVSSFGSRDYGYCCCYCCCALVGADYLVQGALDWTDDRFAPDRLVQNDVDECAVFDSVKDPVADRDDRIRRTAAHWYCCYTIDGEVARLEAD